VDLVVLAGQVPPELERWVRGGGRLLVASSRGAPFQIAETGRHWERAQGYLRIRDHHLFPSLRHTQLVMLDGEFTESEGASPLTFVPPSMFGPPEKVHVDMKDTAIPGLVLKDHGQGKVAWLPWDLGQLYYRHSQASHAGLMHDLINLLLPLRAGNFVPTRTRSSRSRSCAGAANTWCTSSISRAILRRVTSTRSQ
jgi:hypothetical protein